MMRKVFYKIAGLVVVVVLIGVGCIAPNSTDEPEHERSVSVPNNVTITDASAGMSDSGAGMTDGDVGIADSKVGTEDDCDETADGSTGYGQEQPGQGRNTIVRDITWETITGTVISIDSEATIQTATDEVQLGMGPSTYWADFGLVVGDEVTVTGYHEDGEFKVSTIENLATGAPLTLRDETGRPIWAGQGQQNRVP